MSLLRVGRQLATVLGQALTHSGGSAGSTTLPTQHNTWSRCFHSLRSLKVNTPSLPGVAEKSLLQKVQSWQLTSQRPITLEYMHRKGIYKKKRKKRSSPLEGNPQLKGVVLKTLIKKPKKPNSANRKCVRLRLSTGKEALAYVPGEGHNLQEHNIVLVQGGRLQDTPGVKLTCIRGKFDLPHVKKKTQ